MSFVSIAKRKGLPKKLRHILEDVQREANSKKMKDMIPILNELNQTLNSEEYKKVDLPRIINQKLYRDDTVKIIIDLIPFFDQPTINALSTLFQTTIREFLDESLPSYLIKNPKSLETLLSYLEQPQVSNFAHLIIRVCTNSKEFTVYLYESGIVGSFIQNLSGNDFDKLSTAFATYDALLNSHPEQSSQFVDEHWDVFIIQFKQLLSSPNYLVQLTYLPILIKFLTLKECRGLFLRFLEDVENLQLVMYLFNTQSKKVQYQSYSLFKLFVINPRRSPQITSALKKNKNRLISFIQVIQMEDDPELEDERNRVVSTIAGLT